MPAITAQRSVNPFQWLLVVFYIWILLEGVFRKWLLPGLASPLFFVKYLLIFLGMIFIIVNRNRISRNDYPFGGFYFFLVFYCLLQLANQHVFTSVIGVIVGIVVHLAFSILMFILPQAIKSKQDVQHVLNGLNIILIPIFILGIIQYFSFPYSYINKYVVDDMSIAKVGDHARITTVFSYLAPYTIFLGYTMLLLFFQLISVKKMNIHSIFLGVLLLLAVTNGFMTGSRGVIVIGAVQMLFIFFVVVAKASSQELIKKVLIGCVCLILGYVILISNSQSAEAIHAFAERMERSSDIQGRIESAFDPFKFSNYSGLIGNGIGATYQGNGRYVERWKMPGYYEKESERIVLEIGVVGFFIYFLLRASIFIYGLKLFFSIQDQWLKTLVLVILVSQFTTVIFFSMAIFNWLENILYWTGTGMLVCIKKIVEHERAEIPSARLAAR